MTSPSRFFVRMLLFVLGMASVAALLHEQLVNAFLVSPILNALIIGVLLIGLVVVFRQVLILRPEVAWINAFRSGEPGHGELAPPRLLGPVATLLSERQGRLTLSALSLRSLLDSISARLDESREIARYLIGLEIFLGLLGTFWGLLETVQAVGGVIANLSFGGGDIGGALQGLKQGLEAPLSGMGTAFSSSLLGLSGSLVLGFLDLQAGQAQNRFYNDLEEWLASQTRLQGASSFSAEGSDQPVPAYLQALIEQNADSLENLQRTIARGEEARRQSSMNIIALTEKLALLSDQMKAEQQLLVRLAEGQMAIAPVLQRLADATSTTDDALRAHVRNIELYLARLLEEMASGRAQSVEEVRSEIRLLARTIAAIAEESSR